MSEALEDWIGRTEIRRQFLDIESLRRFAAAVGSDLDVERSPPPLGHWAYFNEVVGPEGIGEDGHPRRGGFLPPVTLPRRMFAQAELEFAAPLALGEAAELHMQIADVRRRSGRSGELVLVEVERRLEQGGSVRLTERQTIVYREAGEATPAVAPTLEPSPDDWHPTTPDLMRFSAATFNSHRIHYDAPYAREVEGYPALVVHGPFTAAKLFDLATKTAGGPLKSFGFRAMSPLFLGQPIRLAVTDAGVEAVRCDGATAMAATFAS